MIGVAGLLFVATGVLVGVGRDIWDYVAIAIAIAARRIWCTRRAVKSATK
jgi:hypothetical protein